MVQLFLTSSVDFVAEDIAKRIGPTVKGMTLAFIGTAAEPEKGDLQWQRDDRASLVTAGFDVFDYTLTGKMASDIHRDLDTVDCLYISGGNTFYLLEKIQQSGFAEIVQEYVKQGKIYIGTSAGSIVTGPNTYPALKLDTLDCAPHLKGYEGLNLVNVVVLPHWGSDNFKDLYLKHRMEHAYTEDYALLMLTNYQYVWVQDDKFQLIDVRHIQEK